MKQIIEVICPGCKKKKLTIINSEAAKAGQLLGSCFDCWMAEKRGIK